MKEEKKKRQLLISSNRSGTFSEFVVRDTHAHDKLMQWKNEPDFFDPFIET